MPPLLLPRSSELPEPPQLADFTPAEGRIIAKLRTPSSVQAFLNKLPYNTEPAPHGPTLRTFRGVVRTHNAHCLEAALSAAVILEQHGYPPLVMDLESIDGLDHVIFVYRERARWGSVARSRDVGLHGRKPVFRSLRALALSYFEPYVDTTGCIRAYGAVDLRVLGSYNWRLSSGNVWRVAQMLYDIPHARIRSSEERVHQLRLRYFRQRREHPDTIADIYDQATWS